MDGKGDGHCPGEDEKLKAFNLVHDSDDSYDGDSEDCDSEKEHDQAQVGKAETSEDAGKAKQLKVVKAPFESTTSPRISNAPLKKGFFSKKPAVENASSSVEDVRKVEGNNVQETKIEDNGKRR